MSRILSKNHHIALILEFYPYGYVRSGSSVQELVDILASQRFQIYDIGRNGVTRTITRLSFKDLLQDYHAHNINDKGRGSFRASPAWATR